MTWEIPAEGEKHAESGEGVASIDTDAEFSTVREDLVDRVYNSLDADAQRGDGEVKRADVNRAYIRRNLTIAECMEVESRLTFAGHVIVDEDDGDLDEELPDVKGSSRKKPRYLTFIEEKELGRKVQLLAKLEQEGALENKEYTRQVRKAAENAKKKFVETNVRYVEKLARKSGDRRHMAVEDLMQEGMIGLLRAVDMFDPEKGFRFKTYATWWIQQRIHRAISDYDRIVRLPVHLHEKMRRIRRAQANFTFTAGRPPTHQELADVLGLDAERLLKLMWRVQVTDVSDGDATIAEDLTLMSLVADGSASPFDIAAHREVQNQIADILSTLHPREERVIRMRFGIGMDDEYTLDSIGKEYSVTRERIRQIESKALNKLRRPDRLRKLIQMLDK